MLKHLVRCQALRVIHCQQAWYQLLCWARNFIPERRGKFKFSGQNFVEEFITVVRFAVNRQRTTVFIILWQLLATSSSDDATAMIVSTNGERYTLASLHFSSQFRCNGQQHAYRQNIPSMWSIQLQKPLHPTLCLKKQRANFQRSLMRTYYISYGPILYRFPYIARYWSKIATLI